MISPGSTLKSFWEIRLHFHHSLYKKQTQFLCLSMAFSLLFPYRSHIYFYRSFILVSWFCESQHGLLIYEKLNFFSFSPLHSVIKPFSEFCVKCVKEILPWNPQLPGCLASSQLHEGKSPSGHIKRIPSRLSKTWLGISGWGLQTWHSQNRNLDMDVSCFQVTLNKEHCLKNNLPFLYNHFLSWQKRTNPPDVTVYLTKLRAFFKSKVNHQ